MIAGHDLSGKIGSGQVCMFSDSKRFRSVRVSPSPCLFIPYVVEAIRFGSVNEEQGRQTVFLLFVIHGETPSRQALGIRFQSWEELKSEDVTDR